MTKTRPNPE